MLEPVLELAIVPVFEFVLKLAFPRHCADVADNVAVYVDVNEVNGTFYKKKVCGMFAILTVIFSDLFMHSFFFLLLLLEAGNNPIRQFSNLLYHCLLSSFFFLSSLRFLPSAIVLPSPFAVKISLVTLSHPSTLSSLAHWRETSVSRLHFRRGLLRDK